MMQDIGLGWIISVVTIAGSFGGTQKLPGYSLEGHKSRINAIAFSPCGGFLATADGDLPEIWIWSLKEKKVTRKLATKNQVRCFKSIQFSADGKRIAACNWYYVGAWDLASAALIKEHSSETKPIYSIAFFPNGNSIAVGISDTLAVFDLNDGAVHKRVMFANDTAVYAVSISSDAKDLFLWKGEKDHYGALIDTTTWKTKCEFKDAEVHPIAASCILGNGQIATGGTDGHVTVWDIGNGKRIASYRLDKSTIISIRCRNSTDQLIAATADGMLGMLTVKTKKLSLRPGDPISCMAVSPDGKIVGIGYGDSTASSYDKINQGMVRVLEIP